MLSKIKYPDLNRKARRNIAKFLDSTNPKIGGGVSWLMAGLLQPYMPKRTDGIQV